MRGVGHVGCRAPWPSRSAPSSPAGTVKEFIELPFRLHATSPQWVPPLRLERRLFLSRRFNAFFKHGEAQLFLARRDGRVVGRISAQVDHAYNEFHDDATGACSASSSSRTTPRSLPALLDAAEAWLRAPAGATA